MSSTASEHFGVFLEEFGGFLLSTALLRIGRRDGSNYQRQQLREGQASAHQSELLHRHCVLVCDGECVKEQPPVVTCLLALQNF